MIRPFPLDIYHCRYALFRPFSVDWSPGHYAPMSDGTGTGVSLVDAQVILSANLSLPILPDNPYILACPDGYGLRGVRLYLPTYLPCHHFLSAPSHSLRFYACATRHSSFARYSPTPCPSQMSFPAPDGMYNALATCQPPFLPLDTLTLALPTHSSDCPAGAARSSIHAYRCVFTQFF